MVISYLAHEYQVQSTVSSSYFLLRTNTIIFLLRSSDEFSISIFVRPPALLLFSGLCVLCFRSSSLYLPYHGRDTPRARAPRSGTYSMYSTQ
jgi:hypothetical protein